MKTNKNRDGVSLWMPKTSNEHRIMNLSHYSHPFSYNMKGIMLTEHRRVGNDIDELLKKRLFFLWVWTRWKGWGNVQFWLMDLNCFCNKVVNFVWSLGYDFVSSIQASRKPWLVGFQLPHTQREASVFTFTTVTAVRVTRGKGRVSATGLAALEAIASLLTRRVVGPFLNRCE
jgi:hypothetical protein